MHVGVLREQRAFFAVGGSLKQITTGRIELTRVHPKLSLYDPPCSIPPLPMWVECNSPLLSLVVVTSERRTVHPTNTGASRLLHLLLVIALAMTLGRSRGMDIAT